MLKRGQSLEEDAKKRRIGNRNAVQILNRAYVFRGIVRNQSHQSIMDVVMNEEPPSCTNVYVVNAG